VGGARIKPFVQFVGGARIKPFVQFVGGARIEPFAHPVGALAYYTIIIHCIVVSDGAIIPPYNITGIIPQLYIWTNTITPMAYWGIRGL
jgi:hypothetical protein